MKGRDPFERQRLEDGAVEVEILGHPFLLVLGYGNTKNIARDWDTFTSNVPFRVPIPPEHNGRSVAQLPLESDPPATTEYRRIVADPFSRATAARIEPEVTAIADGLIDAAVDQPVLEVMTGYALPLFVRALALMLGRPEQDAKEWLSWGRYVFPRTPDGKDYSRNLGMDSYLDRVIDQAIEKPGDDFFGLLATARFDKTPLTRNEMLGLANLALAGGRDTTTGVVSNAVHYLATHPDDLTRLRERPDLVHHASEEMLRYFSPLPFMGRVTKVAANVCGHEVAANSVVGLGFASANRDASVFERAEECVIDRKPNRHVAFGHGPHTCLGAPLARMILNVTLSRFSQRVGKISVVGEPLIESLDFGGGMIQEVGFDELRVQVERLA